MGVLVFPAGEDAPVLAAWAASMVSRRPFRFRVDAEESLALLEILAGSPPQSDGRGTYRFRPEDALRGGPRTLEWPEGRPLVPVVAALASTHAAGRAPLSLTLQGTTHPVSGLSFHDFIYAGQALLASAGVGVELDLERASFGEEGGGRLLLRSYPTPRFRGLERTQRGLLQDVRVTASVASRARQGARWLGNTACERLRALGISAEADVHPLPSARGGGELALIIDARFEHTRVSFTTVGDGTDPERVALRAVEALRSFLSVRGAVQARLSESLLLPCALAASRFHAVSAIARGRPEASRWTTDEVTYGLLAAAEALRVLLDVDIRVLGLPGASGVVDVRPRE